MADGLVQKVDANCLDQQSRQDPIHKTELTYTMQAFVKPAIRIDAPEGSGDRWWKNVRGSFSEEEDSEGSYFEVVGFAALENSTDAIPRQSIFQKGVRCFVTKAAATSGDKRIALTERLFEYLLRPEYSPYHRTYTEWQATMLAKCDEFCADLRATKRLRTLCRRFQRLYPLTATVVDSDPQGWV